MRATAYPVSRLNGALRAPGDKSCSHRAIMLGAIANGVTEIEGLLEAEDVLNTAKAANALGAKATRIALRRWRIKGVGPSRLSTPAETLDFGNAGTGSRLMMGLIAGQGVSAAFDGDASLRSRPMGRILEPLLLMGAQADSQDGKLPLTLRGGALKAIDYAPPHASAQVKSAVLLAGLGAAGETIVREARRTRDHTENMLRAFAVDINVALDGEGARISLRGGQELAATSVDIPGDPSSAAFLWMAGLLAEKGEIEVRETMVNPLRDGLVSVAQAMGAQLDVVPSGAACGEKIGRIHAAPSHLNAFDPPPDLAPSMIDEFPIFGVAAAFATGVSTVAGAEELRVKESDRAASTVAMLKANGVEAEERPDGFVVTGKGRDGVPGGGVVEARHDHRIAMSALVMGCAAQQPVTVDDVSSVATSYPDFFSHMRALGADIRGEDGRPI